jgi:hypothetical protein
MKPHPYSARTEEYQVSFYFAFDWYRNAEWNFQQFGIPALTVWYILEGSRRLETNGEMYDLKKGDLVVLPAHAVVTTTSHQCEPAPIHYLSMGFQFLLGGMDWSELYGVPLSMPMSGVMILTDYSNFGKS